MADAIYHFIWDELCDWYIEWSKPALYSPESPGQRRAAQETLVTVLTSAMKLLHPIMPFFSEEVYQALPGAGESIMVSEFPVRDEEKEDAALESGMALVQDIVLAVRNIRSENLVPAGAKTKVTLVPDGAEAAAMIRSSQGYILSPPQVQIAELVIAEPGAETGKKAVTRRCGPVQVSVHIAGLVNPEEEIKRIDKELTKLEAELKKVEGKLGNQGFLAKAPAEVVEKQKEVREELTAKRATLRETRKRMEALLE
jgi:valyl-tRNA synthetase